MHIFVNLKTEEKIMKKLIYIGLGLTSLLTYAMANVPHTFNANTVAKASEVNDNFSSLDHRITALENNSASQSKSDSSSSTSYENCDKSVFLYHYQHIPSKIGDVITIGDAKYKIVAIPFEEFASKEHYYIKYPVKIDKDGHFSYTSLNLGYVQKGNSCYPDNIKGFPAKIYNPNYSRIYTLMDDYNSDTSEKERKLNISDSSWSNVQIKINQTTILLYIGSSTKLQSKIVSNSKVDFRSDINWQRLNIQKQLPEQVKRFLNYIDIVKIEN